MSRLGFLDAADAAAIIAASGGVQPGSLVLNGLGGLQSTVGAVVQTGPQTFTIMAKRKGWTAATGTATRTTFDTTSVTLATLAEHVKALIDDLTANGVIGS